MPTFGKDTIRKFTKNCSELKKMAARDFEDLLQVGDAHFRVGLGLNILETVCHSSL